MPPPRDVLPVSFSGESGGTLGGFIRRPVRVPPRARVIWLGYDKRHPTVSRTPDVMGGTAVFHGTRVSVQTLLDYLEAGESIEDVLEASRR